MSDDSNEAASASVTRVPRVRWWFLVPAIAAPGLVVFVLPMVSLITRNAEYFAGAYSAGRRVYIAGALITAVGIGLWAARRTAIGRIAFTGYLLITPAFVVYTVLGNITRSISLAVIALFVVAAAAILIERSGRTKLVGTIAMIATVLLAASLVSTMLEAASPPTAESASAKGGKKYGPAPTVPDRKSGAELPNIYHVVLDEYQNDQFDASLDDEVRTSLQGFTYFPDAMTTYGRTEMSLADMFDESGYDYSTRPAEFVTQALLDPTSTLQQLREVGYRTTGWLPTRSLWGVPSDPFDEVVLATDAALSDPGSDYADLASSMWVDATAPDAVTQRIIPARHYDQLSTKALLPDNDPAVSVQSFHTFLNRERQLPATGRYTLIHLIVPHHPYVLTPDCAYTPGVDTDGVQQSRCAMTLMGELFDQLDELGRLDSSTIVIHGDHGAGLERVGDTVKELPPDYFGVPWSEARSRPLLLVKPAGADRSKPLIVSDRRALTTDIPVTIFDSVDQPVTVTGDRVSLFATEFPDRPKRTYHFYDKDPAGLPAGSVVRYTEEDGVLTQDKSVPVPTG